VKAIEIKGIIGIFVFLISSFFLTIKIKEYSRARNIANQNVMKNSPNDCSIPRENRIRISPNPKDFLNILINNSTPQIISGRYIFPNWKLKKKKDTKLTPSSICARFLGTELLK